MKVKGAGGALLSSPALDVRVMTALQVLQVLEVLSSLDVELQPRRAKLPSEEKEF